MCFPLSFDAQEIERRRLVLHINRFDCNRSFRVDRLRRETREVHPEDPGGRAN